MERRWSLELWRFEIDDAAQLGRLREALQDDNAYAALVDCLEELKAIVQRAKAEGCNLYGSRLVASLETRMWFQDAEGKEVKAQISFTQAYEQRSDKPLSLSTALALDSAVLTLVLNSDGMEPLRRQRRR